MVNYSWRQLMAGMEEHHTAMTPPSVSSHDMMHMTFYWGKDAEVLFSGWPGTSGAMYGISLIFVFALAFGLEWLAYFPHFMRSPVLQTFRHMVRVGFAYMVMLALMSFNGGVFFVAVMGHTLGFWIFGRSSLSDTTDVSRKLAPGTNC